MKKLLSLVLALAMILMVGAAFAGSITITNSNSRISIDGKTYSAYKLFDSTHNGTAYAYTMSTNNQFYDASLLKKADEEGVPATGLTKLLWDTFTFTAIAGDTTKVNVTPKGTFEEAEAREFADAMEQYLTGKTPDYTGTASGQTATINNVDNGYYLITGGATATSGADPTNLVSAVILTNENPNPVVKPKADAPTLDKKITGVAEGTTVIDGAVLDEDGVAAVAKIGSTVSFALEAVVPDLTGYDDYTYTFQDTMSAGLTYVADSYTIKFGETDATAITPTVDGQTFTYTVPYATLKSYDAGTKVVLAYKATVNSNALTYDKENNTAKLTYSNNPYDNTTEHTPEDKVYIIDINLDVDKVNEGGDKLSGAKFVLYRMNGSSEEYYKWANDVVTWVNKENAQVFETNNGKLTTQIQGLDKGTYYLLETEAPTGYNPLPDAIEVVISVAESDNKVTYTATYGGEPATMTNGLIDLTTQTTNNKQPVATGSVLNQSGTILPSTGGIGTTIFYVLGGLLVVGAAVILVARRKAHE